LSESATPSEDYLRGELRADPGTVEGLLRPSAYAIPVVGAGVPVSAGLPSGYEMARHLVQRFELGLGACDQRLLSLSEKHFRTQLLR